MRLTLRKLTPSDYWMGRDRIYRGALSKDIQANAADLLERVNSLLAEFGEYRHVTSGWRPPQVNATTAGAAKFSKHMTGQAIDLQDHEGDLDEWCLDNPGALASRGLYQEHPSATKGWCHLQSLAPKSGKRVFYP